MALLGSLNEQPQPSVKTPERHHLSGATLESPLDCKEIQPVHPKGNQSLIFMEGLMLKLKLQYFGHLMGRTDSLEKTLMLGKTKGGRRRGQQRMRWLDGHGFEHTPGVGDGQGGLACCGPWGHRVRTNGATEQRQLWTNPSSTGEQVKLVL